MILGPDAQRYMIAGDGRPVARPFHLRWMLPAVCKTDPRRWWAVWAVSWPLLFASVAWLGSSMGWPRALAAAVFTVALPGVWGPQVVRPVGVDLPAMALGAMAAALTVNGHAVWGVVVVCLVAHVKETAPVFAALWAWHPVLLVGLVMVAFNAAVIRPGMDPVTERFREIHDRPIRAAWEYRKALNSPNLPWWRNGWVLVAPWGVCLAGLYRPSWAVVTALAAAYAQLVVATDTNRLLHTAAGPALALAAAGNIPTPWLLVACVAHVFWFVRCEAM